MGIPSMNGMSECRLFEESGRRHFMTCRFDRLLRGEKLHMQSLAAMAHFDFNQAGTNSYEQALQMVASLGLPLGEVEQLFTRMVFNIITRNQDDHVKNIAFLMDRSGTWSLAPAFDITYSYQPNGRWTSSHQMTLNGKRDDFTMEDFKSTARSVFMKRGRAQEIIEKVSKVVERWQDYAKEAGVTPGQSDQIQNVLRLGSWLQ
jgi:serine/threonine-protein kinase HipA